MATSETVGLLFCDVVASTELLVRLGDDLNDEVRRNLFACLRDAIASHRGQEVKNLGDGLMVAFPTSVADAVSCAVGMQRAVAVLNQRDPLLHLAIRAGVSVGEASREDGDFFGTPVVEAARLCARARGGQILASDVVRVLVGTRGGLEFSPVGALELKGLPDPLPACEVAWEPAPGLATVPLPAGLAARGARFVGRAAERGVLGEAWAQASAGLRVVLVGGEAGIGKTELVAEVARGVHTDGAVVLYGRCDAELAVAYQPIAEALRWYTAACPAELLRAQLGPLGGELTRIVASLAARVPELGPPRAADPDTERAQLAEAVAHLLGRASESAPLLLVLEDLHSASVSTLALLGQLLGSPVPMRVLVVGTYRSTEVAGTPLVGTLGALSGDARVTRLDLGGLAERDVAALAAAAGCTPGAQAEVARALGAETDGNPTLVAEVLGRLAETDTPVSGVQVREVLARTCPYQGLAAFGPDDQAVFFGRDELVASLVARLAEVRLLAVVGPSGSGKSSAVRAGLLPALTGGALPGSAAWPTVVLNPGAQPLVELSAQLAGLGPLGSGALLAELEADPRALDLTIRQLLPDRPAGAQMVLVVDQFEELFTLCRSEDERASFVTAVLHAASAPGGRSLVVLVLRADFYGHCATYPALAAALETSQALLGPMGDDELRATIEGPARVAGLRLEAGLTEHILRDVAGEPGGLPLLSHALLETWRRREHRTLTVTGYDQAGGVRGAIAQTADTTYTQGLDPTQQALARAIFLRLTELGEGTEDTRRRVPIPELATGPDHTALDTVLATLTDARLLTTSTDTVEVAHEALIREWPRLRAWLDEDREGLRTHRHLTHTAHEWETLGREPAELYRGPRLTAALEWSERDATNLNPLERDFLDTGREREAREQAEARHQVRRLRRLLIGASLALVAALLAASVAVVQRTRAGDEANKARAATRNADVGRLVAESKVLQSQDRYLGALLAVEANRLRDDASTRDAMFTAVLEEPRLRATLAGPTNGVWVFPDGRTVLLHRRSSLELWDLKTEARVTRLPLRDATGAAVRGDGALIAGVGRDGTVSFFDARGRPVDEPIKTGIENTGAGMAFSPDGRLIATAFGELLDTRPAPTEASVRIYDVATRTPFGAPLSGHSASVVVVAFSPDGRLLATGGNDDLVVLHDLATGTVAGPPIRVGAPATALAFDPIRPRLTVGLGIFDITTRAPVGFLTGTGAVAVSAYSADGTKLAVGTSATTQVYDAETLEPVGRPIEAQAGVGALGFDPAARRLVIGGPFGPLTVWDLAGTSVLARPVPGAPAGVIPSPDGKVLLAPDLADSVTLLDAADLSPLGPPLSPGPGAPVAVVTATPAAFRPDGRQMAVINRSGKLQVYDVASRRPSGRPIEVGFATLRTEYSPDGRRLAVSGRGGEVALVDLRTRRVRRLGGSLRTLVTGLSFSPDGRQLAAADVGSSAVIFDGVDTARPRARDVTDRFGPQFVTLRFAPRGRTLAVGEAGSVQLYDAVTLRRRGGPIPVGTRTVLFLEFSPDGRLLEASDVNNQARILDVHGRRPLGLPLPLGALAAVGFTHNSKQVGLSAPSGAALWNLDPTEWRNQACHLAGRNLTRAEFAQYLPGQHYRATCPQWPLNS